MNEMKTNLPSIFFSFACCVLCSIPSGESQGNINFLLFCLVAPVHVIIVITFSFPFIYLSVPNSNPAVIV